MKTALCTRFARTLLLLASLAALGQFLLLHYMTTQSKSNYVFASLIRL